MRHVVLIFVALLACMSRGYAEYGSGHNHDVYVQEGTDDGSVSRAVLGHMIQSVLKQARDEGWTDKKIATELQSVLDEMRRENYNQAQKAGSMTPAFMEQKIKSMSAEVAYFIAADVCAVVMSLAALCVTSYLVALALNE